MDDDLDAYLTQYRPLLLSARHQALTRRLLRWLLQHCTCPHGARRHAREAFLAAAFEEYCAPPDASEAEIILCAKFTSVFFIADDGDDWHVAAQDSDELTDCYSSLVADLGHGGQQTARFEATVNDMVAGMREEQAVDVDTITMRRHREIRRRTIGVLPYIMCRRVARGLFFTAEVEKALDDSGLIELAWEICALTNDLGSLRNDARTDGHRATSVSLNFVWLRARDHGDLDAAVRETIDHHNQLVDTFQTATRSIAAQARTFQEPRMIEYADILRVMLIGNLRTTRYLVPHRYPGTEGYLRQLHHLPAQ